MKNILKKVSYLSLFLAIGLVISSCSNDDDNVGNDAAKVVPIISAVNGNSVAYEGDTYIYTLQPYRGGSTYNWTVTGATMQPVDGRPDQISVTFTDNPAVTISVSETAANGSTSDVMTKNITVFGAPCDWTVEMIDSYGDGWNGAAISFSFEGTSLGSVTLNGGFTGSADMAVPGGGQVTISFVSGAYDNEVSFNIYDPSGALVVQVLANPVAGQLYTGTNTCP